MRMLLGTGVYDQVMDACQSKCILESERTDA